MKKIYLFSSNTTVTIGISFFTIFLIQTVSAQSPSLSFNYQAIARDMNEQPYKGTDDEPLQIAIEIYNGQNKVVYSEDHHDIRTSSLGIFNLRIGEGDQTSPEGLEEINWSMDGPFDLLVSIKIGTAAYRDLPRSRLVFVPFAIYATKAGDLENDLGGDVSGKYTNVQLNSSVVGNAEIADNAVTTGKIADGAVNTGDLADDAVTTDKIAPEGVKTANIEDGGVTNSKIANGAVNNAKLQDSSVTTEKIAANGVTNSDIINMAVDNAKIDDNAVTTTKILDGEVTTGDIQDGAITALKLNQMGAINGKVLKWSNGVWGPQDDGGASLVGGSGININGSTISAVDNSATNEIQAISWDGQNATLGLSNGGGAVILNTGGNMGDVLGDLNNLQIQQNTVGSTEIIDGSVGGADLNSILNLTPAGINFNGGPLFLNGSVSVNTLGTNYNYYGFRDVQFSSDGCGPCFNINQQKFGTTTYVQNFMGLGLGALGTNDFINPYVNYSLITPLSIRAHEFHATSDIRIKKNIKYIDKSESLSILNHIKVRNYQHRDYLEFGHQIKKGFIAQEVEQVFPEAVSRTTDFIPDIYQIARQVQYEPAHHTLTLIVDSLTGGLQAGDKLRIIADQQREVIVSAVNGTTITVADWPAANTKEAFVYGKQVNDFRVVDYDRIFTLNVSATQALISEVDELKAQVVALQAQNSLLNTQNAEFEKGLQLIQTQVQELKSQLNANIPTVKTGEK